MVHPRVGHCPKHVVALRQDPAHFVRTGLTSQDVAAVSHDYIGLPGVRLMGMTQNEQTVS
jgi:hypothetical protein